MKSAGQTDRKPKANPVDPAAFAKMTRAGNKLLREVGKRQAARIEAREARRSTRCDVLPRAKGARLWRKAFLAQYAAKGTVTGAAEACGVHFSTVYATLAVDPTLRAQMDAAREVYTDRREMQVDQRAFDGVSRPVYQGGALVGSTTEYSDRLAELRLKALRPSAYREATAAGAGGPVSFNVTLGITTRDGDPMPPAARRRQPVTLDAVAIESLNVGTPTQADEQADSLMPRQPSTLAYTAPEAEDDSRAALAHAGAGRGIREAARGIERAAHDAGARGAHGSALGAGAGPLLSLHTPPPSTQSSGAPDDPTPPASFLDRNGSPSDDSTWISGIEVVEPGGEG